MYKWVKIAALFAFASLLSAAGRAQTLSPPSGDTFRLVLPNHQGLLQWHGDGLKVDEYAIRQGGGEMSVSGGDATGRLSFLGFLSTVPDQAPATSAKCADNALQAELRENPTVKTTAASQVPRPDEPPLQLVTYKEEDEDGKFSYSVRGFIATGDICGDLEFFSALPISASDPDLKKIWASYHFTPKYDPQFTDVFLYAQVLFQSHRYDLAGPMYEQALLKLKDDGSSDQKMWRRFATAQAGESYGMAGDINRARTLLQNAVAKDPGYPAYYYKLARADAADNKLDDARTHLQQAFARKENLMKGETLPDPTTDDTFQPYKDNKDFWAFLQTLH